MLEKLGITALQEKVYTGLIDDPTADAERLATALGVPLEDIERELSALTASGLISLTPDGETSYALAPPEPAIKALIHREEEELEHLRAHAATLAQRLRASRQRLDVSSMVEIVVGIHAIAARWEQAQRQATRSVRLIDRPPYHLGPRQNYTERDLLDRGIAYRTLYDAEILQFPLHLDRAQECITWGEEARVVADIPIKMAIVDRSLVLLILLDETPNQEAAAILVHPSVLFDSLLELFELMWRRAVPLRVHLDSDDSERDDTLINLLAAGLKDEAIAHDMGVSVRTVRRKIKDLCEELGVRSRFQAGVALKERGLL